MDNINWNLNEISVDSHYLIMLHLSHSFFIGRSAKSEKNKWFKAVKIQPRAISFEPSDRDPTFSHTKHSPSACPEKIPRDPEHQRHTADIYSAFCHPPRHLNAHYIFGPFRKFYVPFHYVGILTMRQLKLKVVQQEQRPKLTRKRKTWMESVSVYRIFEL